MEVDEIVVDYLAGVTVPNLAAKYHHTDRTISHLLRGAGVLGMLQRRRGVARRGRPSHAHLHQHGLACTPDAPAWPYIAGMLDGEGSIVGYGPAGLDGPRQLEESEEVGKVDGRAPIPVHKRYRVTVVQKDPTPLQWMRHLLGTGSICFANGTYRYQVAGQRAVFELLRAVLPYLIVKGEAARDALDGLAVSYGWDWKPQA